MTNITLCSHALPVFLYVTLFRPCQFDRHTPHLLRFPVFQCQYLIYVQDTLLMPVKNSRVPTPVHFSRLSETAGYTLHNTEPPVHITSLNFRLVAADHPIPDAIS